MSLKVLLEPGDCFSIPLPDGRFAFGQYLYMHSFFGPLIRVFDLLSDEIPQVETLAATPVRIPLISVGLNPPVRMKRWKKIGNVPVGSVPPPRFRMTLKNMKGVNDDWVIWEDTKWNRVGFLRPEDKALEPNGVWSFQDLEDRILTGKDPFSDGVE